MTTEQTTDPGAIVVVPDGHVITADFLEVVRKSAELEGWCSTAEEILHDLLGIECQPPTCVCASCRSGADGPPPVVRFTPEADAPKTIHLSDIIAAIGYLAVDRPDDTAKLRKELNTRFALGLPERWV